MSEQSNSGKVAIILIITVIILVGGTGAWYFFMYKPEQEAKERARMEQIAREKAEQERIALEAQNRLKYDQLITDADSAFALEEWETARSLYTEALSLFSDEQYPMDQLAIVNAKLNEMARMAEGTFETVTSPTGRFYIIVSSSIDDDLAMDYARKLANKGNSVKIIEHNYNELPFFGVSPGDYGTWDQAEAALTSFSTFSKELWILKY